MTAGTPRTHRAPQPQDMPEVAHNGQVPDSGGLVLAPDDDLAWVRAPLGRHSLVPVHGGYSGSDEPPATTAPCVVCGTPAPLVMFKYALDLVYAVCPIQDLAECIKRGRKERAAVTELIAAPAEAEEPAEPAAEPAPGPAAKAPAAPRKPRARASTARTKTAPKAAEAAAEDATEPPEGGAA